MKQISCKNKILFTIPTLNGGGAERVFVNYINSLDASKYNTNLVLVDKVGVFLELLPEYAKIYDLGKKKTRFSFFKLLKTIKIINPDLIVSTTNRMNILVLFVSFMISSKVKICLYEPSMPSAQFGEKYLPRYYLVLMKFLYRRADYIIAQTEDMKSEIINYYNVRIENVLVTINPLDTEFINKNITQQDNPYNSNYINVVASGRIREEKGYKFLLKSFVKVINNNPRYRLHILGSVGSKQYMEELKQFIKDNGLQKYVLFGGFKINPFPYYKFADLFVLSSKWEGLPNVVLEALYLQTPIVVTDCIPYFRKLIKSGKNGFIVKYDDANDFSKKILRYNELR